MDHAIRGGGAPAQAVEVLKVAAKGLGARCGKRLGARIRAGEAEHLMTRADEFLNDGGADKARSSSDEDTHRDSPDSGS